MKHVTVRVRGTIVVSQYLFIISALLFLCGMSAEKAQATANYVYHERTTNDPGCGGQFVSNLNPGSADAVTLRFKVEYQFYTDNARVYYTTDGTDPSGAYGTPSGTTQVLTASWVCIFNAGQNVDVWEATIPAQQGGKTVKYVISAWHSGGGSEIFANSGEFFDPKTTSSQATQFSYTVTCPTISVSPSSLTNGTQGSSYSQSITASGGISAYTYLVTSGSLPSGLSLSSSGSLSGTPTVSGTYNFTVTATDANNCTGSKAYSLTLNPAPPKITSFSPSSGSPGSSVTITGMYFDPTPANNTVYFGATRATVTGGSSTTSLTVTVPYGATFFPVNVTAGNLTGYSKNPFIVSFNGSYTIDSTTLNTKVDLATGNSPQCVAIGDFDGDGKADLVVSNYGSASVSVFRNISSSGSLTTGSFDTAKIFATGNGPQGLVVADFDRDGKLDIAIAEYGFASVGILRNTSSGAGSITFATRADFGTGASPARVASGDFDGDGKPDLAVTNYGSSSVSILQNNSSPGGITFGTKVDLSIGNTPQGVAVGDMDGDGKVDVIAAGFNGSKLVTVYRNQHTSGVIASGSFASGVNFSTGNIPSDVAVGDLDGDGKLDLAVADYQGNIISVFRNTASPGSISSPESFDAAVDFSSGAGTYPFGIIMTDIDGDGKPEIITANLVGTSVSVLKNTTTSGTFTSGSFATRVLFTVGDFPIGVAAGDLDGDGKPEVIAANQNSNTMSILRNASHIACPAITVNPSSLSSGTTGVGYSETFSASGGTSPYSYAVTSGSLPAGLNFSSNGMLSGSPTAAGTSYFYITATDSNGCTGVRSCTLTVACPTITVSPSSLPDGIVDSAYSQTFSANGGTSPYTFAVTSGSLPAGFNLSSAGLLSGTSSSTGTSYFTVTATDTNGCTGARVCTLTVADPCATTLDQQQLSTASGYASIQSGYTDAQTFTPSQTGDFLNFALYLDRQDGYDAGTLSAGDLIIELQSTVSTTANSFGGGCGTLTRNVPSGTVLGTLTVPSSTVSLNSPQFYSFQFPASVELTGGVTYALVLRNTGSAPTHDGSPGQYLWYEGRGSSSSDLYTGGSAFSKQIAGSTWNISEAVEPNSCNFTIYDDFAFKTFIGGCATPPPCPTITFSPQNLPDATAGSSYSQQLTASGGTAPYRFVVSSGTMPAGLSIDTTGLISGTPGEDGFFLFVVSPTDANGCSTALTCTLTVRVSANGSISGMKWSDLNGDGIKDGGEPGVSGWKIYLTSGRGDSLMTDSTGQYTFSGLSAGVYTVSEELRSGWTQTFPPEVTHTCTLSVGQNITQINFGNHQIVVETPPSFTYDPPEIIEEAEEFCSPLVMNTNNTGSETWFVKAVGGDLEVTLYAHAVNNTDPESVYVQVYNSSSALVTGFGVGYTSGEAASGGIGFEKSVSSHLGGLGTGEILRFVVTTPAPTPSTQPHYRFHFEGAVSAAINSPSFPSFEEEFATWYLNVLPSENLNLDFFTTGVPTPADTVFARVVGPGGIFNPATGLYPISGATEINIPGAASGVWTVSLETVNGHYRIDKTTGADRGIYMGQFSGGMGRKIVQIHHNGSPSTGIPVNVSARRRVLTSTGFEYIHVDSLLTDSSSLTFDKLPVGLYSFDIRPVPPGYTTPATQYDTLFCDSTITNTFDFGDAVTTGTISGMKFEDKNGNGVKDAGDNGLAGWIIRRDGELSDTTDANGLYSFENVPEGIHTISEIQQNGWFVTKPDTGYYTVNLAPGGNITNLNFGNFLMPKIAGRKLHDLNGNHVNDDGEPGLQNWVIRAMKGASVKYDTTDENGNYDFTFMPGEFGYWSVREVDQPGWFMTYGPEEDSIFVEGGVNITNRNFGNAMFGTISGKKYRDKTGNSLTGDDTTLAGWTMKLYSGTEIAAVAVTDANGVFTFSNVYTGAYTLQEVMQNGWTQTYPDSTISIPAIVDTGLMPGPRAYAITVHSGDNITGKDFANYSPGSISGMKFHDVNGNGIKDGGDNGIEGWRIAISGPDSFMDTAITSGDGSYSFSLSNPGTYNVTEVQQAGWSQTTGNPEPISFDGSSNVTGINFGNFKFGTISGKMFNDYNGNGTLDPGEPGIPNWEITYTAIDDLFSDTTYTDSLGNFLFTIADTGEFEVAETQRSEEWVTTTDNLLVVHLDYGEAYSGIEFGNSKLIIVGGKNFIDANENGVDDGEPGLAGWRVELAEESHSWNFHDTTDSNGEYYFDAIPPGIYQLRLISQPGWQVTTTNPIHLVVARDTNITNINFGNVSVGSISGMKFLDVDGDSVKDLNEGGLPGWNIVLQKNGTPVDTVLTDSLGLYSFTNLSPGTYNVSEIEAEGWYQTMPESVSYNLIITNNEVFTGINFGNFEYGTISGTKYWDHDSSGTFDALCEEMVGGVKMVLYGSHTAPDTVTTDASGAFTFSNVPADNFVITEASNSLWNQTFPANGTPYFMTMTSGLDTGGFVFGNFYMPDTGKYRTFTITEYNKSAGARQKSGFSKKPTAGNVRDTVHVSRGFDSPDGYMLIGVERPDSALFYGWYHYSLDGIHPYKASAVKHWLYNLTAARLVTKTRLPGKPKLPKKPTDYISAIGLNRAESEIGNALNYGQAHFIPFVTNIAASDMGVTPPGFGELLYACTKNADQSDSILVGKTLREIAHFWDTVLTMGRLIRGPHDTLYRYDRNYLRVLDSFVVRLNSAFANPSLTARLDTFSTKPLRIKGYKSLYQVPYLRRVLNASQQLRHVEGSPLVETKPAAYRLEQNYPNPFNPTTVIEFELKQESKVTLKIFNLLGQEVATILDGQELEEGNQLIEFNATDYSSGIYFYRLEATGTDEKGEKFTFTSVKKMTLVK